MKNFLLFLLMVLFVSPFTAFAEEAVTAETDVSTEVTAEEIGVSETQLNSATSEATQIVNEAGMLIEIGNTTAENTTIIVRVTANDGTTEDKTLEIDAKTKTFDMAGRTADLSDWIAGDQLSYTARYYTNSGSLVATRLTNRSFVSAHRGINGWIKAIRSEENEVDVSWANQIYTLNLSEAKMVAGLKNPASIEDLAIDDRIRARVVDDGDGNGLTWNANILVVLRRGDSLFMRVTRWVVPLKVTEVPDDLTLPAIIKAEVQESKFFEKGDVNNLIGEPGTIISVEIDESTNLRRRFLGKAFLKEFSEGDMIRVIGRLSESTGNLVAKFVKNDSIQTLGVALKLGRVVAIDEDSQELNIELLLTIKKNRDWTVRVTETTDVIKKNQEVSFSDIVVGNIVRTKGVANRPQKSVTADRIIITK